MPQFDIVELAWKALQDEIAALRTDIEKIAVQYERAEVSENVPASTLATAPLAADGSVANGVNYATLRWISNGRKPGQGAGAGTGVLAVYDSASNTWLEINGYTAVTT